MDKVIVIGCPGSGKSTFARKLGQITGLPLYHLDMMYWNDDRTTVSKEIFLNRLKDVLNMPKWILDGNYISTMEMRLCECDTVFFLDYDTNVCLEGIQARVGKHISDMPWVENNIDFEFENFVKDFNTQTRPEVVKILDKYSGKNIITFTSREQADRYISEF